MSTRRCCPPDRVATSACARSARPDVGERLAHDGAVVARTPASTTGGAAGARPRRSRRPWRAPTPTASGAAGRSRCRVCSAKRSRGVPNSSTSPPSWSVRPRMPRTSVDLPDPLGPRSATTSPSNRSRSTPETMGGRRSRRTRRAGGPVACCRSWALLSGAQGREVDPHDREVVPAPRGAGDALERVEHGDLRARLAGHGLGECGRDQASRSRPSRRRPLARGRSGRAARRRRARCRG